MCTPCNIWFIGPAGLSDVYVVKSVTTAELNWKASLDDKPTTLAALLADILFIYILNSGLLFYTTYDLDLRTCQDEPACQVHRSTAI